MKSCEVVVESPKTQLPCRKQRRPSALLLGFLLGSTFALSAQTVDRPQPSRDSVNRDPDSVDLSLPPVRLRSLPRNLFVDQKNFVTAPSRMTYSQWQWTVPIGFATAALLASDTAVERHVPTNPATVSHAVTASNAGLAAFAGLGAGMYLWGYATNRDQPRETGLLAGEAGIDALIDSVALSYIFGREPPFTGDGRGRFFQGGTSFPSEHAAISWAIASVIAHEYPGVLTQAFAYGAATGVGAARIIGHKHFATDVIVGSALGWYLGREVFRAHSRYSNAQIARFGTFTTNEDEDLSRQPRNMGSPYVPLDSWIYPAIERLTALGYIHSGFADMRPWTRMDCARQIKESSNLIANEQAPFREAVRLNDLLRTEFSYETALLEGGKNEDIRIESVYTRGMEIVNQPLTDGYHFAQTIINDFGRPEEQGFNAVSGVSGWANLGPFSFYVRGEYQHSPFAPALPLSARLAISEEDFAHSLVVAPFPLPPDTPTASFNQGRLLDTYVALNLNNWQLSYGNQSLWWGPSEGGPLMYTDNGQPVRMFRINRVVPFTLPSIFSAIGPIRIEAFLGQYSGQEFVYTPSGLVGQYGVSLPNQPVLHGERISFKPTSNLEIGLSRTTDYGGPGYPVTLDTMLRSLFSTGNTLSGNPNKPGSRRAGLDFSYRLPGLRNLVTFYGEGMAEHNEVTPLIGPDVGAWLGGLYFPRIPKIQKLDLRLEGGYTDPVNTLPDVAFGAFYWDGTWLSGFQNGRHLLGSWIGRQGQGEQAWTTYWFTAHNKLQFGFRHQKDSNEFVPGGGSLTDANVRAEFWPNSTVGFSFSAQYERWVFPVIQPNASTNVAAAIGIVFQPKRFF
jgi:membrane-associated phospholipid phosphatase